MVVWNSVDDLFPRALDVDDLITILSRVDVIDREGGLSFDLHGASLLARLTSRPDLERLLQRLLEMAGPRRREGRREERPKVFLPALSGGAFHLLQLCPPGETPNIAIDCVLRVGDDRQDRLLMREGQGTQQKSCSARPFAARLRSGARQTSCANIPKSAAKGSLTFGKLFSWAGLRRSASKTSIGSLPMVPAAPTQATAPLLSMWPCQSGVTMDRKSDPAAHRSRCPH